MINGIIFDMDGVLIDSEFFYFNRRMTFLEEKRITPYSDNFHDYVGQTNEEIWNQMVKGDSTLKAQLKEEYTHYSQANPLSYGEALNEGVIETIHELKERGCKVSIASSSAKEMIENMIDECGLTSYIDYYISGEELRRSKPDPDIYNKAVKELSLKKKECLAVEDSPLGIQSATSSGLFTLAMKPKEIHLDQSKADVIITNIRQVLNYID